jgi:hypothetical protein
MEHVSRRDALQLAAASGVALSGAGLAAAGDDKKPAREHDLKALETKLKGLRGSLAKLADEKQFEELLVIIHKPGWTTPAEYLLVRGMLDAMGAHAQALVGLKQALMEGSRMVSAS